MSNKLLDATQKQYPFTKNTDVKLVQSNDPGLGFLETWPPQEEGSKDYPRPKTLPMDKYGISVYNKRVSPQDVAADIFSHADNYGQQVGHNVAASLTPGQIAEMRDQYLDYQATIDEGSPHVQERAKLNGTSALLRNAVMNQGGGEGLGQFHFNVAQRNMIDKAKNYVATGKAQPKGLNTVRDYLHE